MERSPYRSEGKKVGSRVFLHLEELLAYHSRIASARNAILAPGYQALTYGALQERVNDVVRELRGLDVGRTDRVAVVLPNGPEAAVALIATASAAVCVPLNPSFTADEWQRYFGDLQIATLLTRADMASASRAVAHDLGIPVIDLLPLQAESIGAFRLLGAGTRRPVDHELGPSAADDAFILLTSGSAARPKLVPLTHSSVCRSAYNAGATLHLRPNDRLLNVLPLFHAHGLISGLLTALAAGSTVVCTPGFEPAAFFSWLTEFRPTWYTAVPAVHRALLASAGRHKDNLRQCSLRLVRSASASLPVNILHELEALFQVPVIETYGMTEAASQIAANPLTHRKPGSVGRPAGAEIAIVDSEGRQCAAGERGEIVLRGPTITRGYENDDAATRAAFRDGWFRTGDLGYLDGQGYLFIVGRAKDIINRGGQKIAPAEIEEVLASHPDVLEAVAFSIPHRGLGEEVAAAIVVRPDREITASKLRSFASERLARFKIPSVIRIVPEIPKGPGGKIRRSDLASALSMAPREHGRKPTSPGSDLECQMARTWADLLELDQVGVHQDVFALGADSLTVTQMLSRLRTDFGVDLSFNDVFNTRTVAALAARLTALAGKPATTPPSLRDVPVDADSAPLSFQQQRIQVLSKLDPSGYNYHVVEVLRLSGPIDVGALQASIAAICDRHEVLKSTFPDRPGELLQVVGSVRLRLERVDIRPCARHRQATTIRSQLHEWVRQSFHPENEPLFRVRLMELDDDDYALALKLHHLVTDGWSQRLFWRELEALYRARVNRESAGVPELPVQYRHFVEWQRGWLATRAADQQRSYWCAQLAGVMALPLRTDRSRPGIRTGRGARQSVKLSRALSRAIKSLSRSHGVTPFMVLLAAFQSLLFRYTQHDDIAVGSVIANRNHIDVERLIGMFANTIVLRTDFSGDPSFGEVLRRVRRVTLDAYRNQDLPFEEVLRSCELPRDVDRNAVFQTMFILQSPPPRAPAFPGVSGRFVDIDPGIARMDLILELIDADEGMYGWFEYSSDLFEPGTMARMATHLKLLLKAVVADPLEKISRLPLLGEEERNRLLKDWNDTRADFRGHAMLWERFAGWAERTPDAVAVTAGKARLSYRELARRSSALAHRLVMKGVGSNVIVILLAVRGIDLLTAMMAVQRAGAAFLPLDPAVPAVRLAKIIQHSGTPMVLVGEGCAEVLEQALAEVPAHGCPQILRLAQRIQVARRDLDSPVRPAPSSLAYVIYTSGSTGVPKGAMIEQRGLLNHLLFKISDLGLSASDVIAQTAPQSFDISVWQFLTALLVGGRVHICADAEVRDVGLLARTIGREGVTVLQIVPALLRAILARMPDESMICALGGLRWLICIGEVLAPDLCRHWLRHLPGVSLINAYGPAECSDTVATYRVSAPVPPDAVPIGRPIANTQLYVLDTHSQPVPIGMVGELYVGGVGVGRGYLNSPEQTRQSFFRDPFTGRGGGRMYRTGDLVRWRSDGVLEFVGRLDHQVKIRGCRIELEEIEHVLIEHSEVRAAVVSVRNDRGEQRLVAYIVAAGGGEPEVDELRQFLKSRLPEYMIPSGFIFLDRLPLTAHGKVDRAALARIRRRLKIAGKAFVAPRDPFEDSLAGIWADLLRLEQVGVFDNFFALGGHSLLAGRVLARITDAFGVSLPLRALFEAPTVAALARRISRGRDARPSVATLEIARAECDGPQPVSITQEHILRIERDLPELPQFNLPFAYRLRGALNVPALERSLVEVVRRHDALRTGFAWVDNQAVALVAPAEDIDSCLVVEDLAARTPIAGRRARALMLKIAELRAEQEACTPFDVKRAPLLRARILRLGADQHVLILIFHHIIVDGWSIGVFMEEVSQLYATLVADRPPRLGQPELQFSDFARWQHRWVTSAAATRQLHDWKERLRGALPMFPANKDVGGALLSLPVAQEPVHVSNDLVARLGELGHARGASLFMTLLACFKTLLLAKSGCNDICVATAMANRSQLKTERMIGPLVNTVLIRTQIDVDLSFQDALDRVRVSVLEAYARQELPFENLTLELAKEGDLDPASLIQVSFVFQNASRPLELPGVALEPFAYLDGQRFLPIDRNWLSVMLKETSSGILGSCSYKSDLLKPNTVGRWIADYGRILAGAVANPETSLGRLADH